MSKNDDAERRALASQPIPAKPKRPSGTAALDEFLGKRKPQLFTEEQPEDYSAPPGQAGHHEGPSRDPEPQGHPAGGPLNYDAFHSFRLILRTLNKYPKATQKEMISLLNELLAS